MIWYILYQVVSLLGAQPTHQSSVAERQNAGATPAAPASADLMSLSQTWTQHQSQ